LIDICEQLSLNPTVVVPYDEAQDLCNKRADLRQLQKALISARDSTIVGTNPLDIQQLIDVRLQSLSKHLPKGKSNWADHRISTEVLLQELQKRMDQEMRQFTSHDIPPEDLEAHSALGCGGFGTVFQATRRSTGELLAVKEVRQDRLSPTAWASLYSEVTTMVTLHHKYVLELVGVQIKEPYRIITRFCPGKSLFDRLHRSPRYRLSSQNLSTIAFQVAEGMRFLHANGIVHRDLKTMNILLDEPLIVKIADFGLAGIMKDQQELVGGVGTPHYTAPEILEGKRYGLKVDVYSFGVMLWEIATGNVPFRDKSATEIYDFVVTHGWRLPLSQSTPEPLKQLIARCWHTNPSERPEFAEIAELFRTGKVDFGAPAVITKNENDSIAFNFPYLLSVLKSPRSKVFASVVHFLVTHMTRPLQKKLRQNDVLKVYNAESPHPDSILLLAASLLTGNEFSSFLSQTALPIIARETSVPAVTACAQFCLKLPDHLFDQVKEFIPKFVEVLSPINSAYLLRILARLPPDEIPPFTKVLLSYFDIHGFNVAVDQDTLNAVSKLYPLIDLTDDQIRALIPLIEQNLQISRDFLDFLVRKTSKSARASLLLAIVTANSETDATDYLTAVLCDFDNFAEEFENVLDNDDHLYKLTVLFERLQSMTDAGKSIKVTLFLLFRLSAVPRARAILANHGILQSVLQIKGHLARRLQIFTSLFASEQFCMDTIYSDGVCKLFIASMDIRSLNTYLLKFIGILSTHEAGRALLGRTGVLHCFSQLFLSANCDLNISLTILSNLAAHDVEIPQLSLIISCLIQDLHENPTQRVRILYTLIGLVGHSLENVQERDLRQSTLPLLSPKQRPEIVFFAIQILDQTKGAILQRCFPLVLQRIYDVLMSDNLQIPQVIVAALGLIASLAQEFDQNQFFAITGVMEYIEELVGLVGESPETVEEIINIRDSLNFLVARGGE
jgi:serine/threonine protein kinase